MKRSRFSEEQIIGILRKGEGGTVKAVCAEHNISEPTHYVAQLVVEAFDIRILPRAAGLDAVRPDSLCFEPIPNRDGGSNETSGAHSSRSRAPKPSAACHGRRSGKHGC